MTRRGSLPDDLPDEWRVIDSDDDDHPRRVLIEVADGEQYVVAQPQGRGLVLTEDRMLIFNEERWARLCFGVTIANKYNGSTIYKTAGDVVPTALALKPQYTAAYLGIVSRRLEWAGELPAESPRANVAKRMDISPQTVSNYWNEVRREPR